jgi:hypothetical protein
MRCQQTQTACQEGWYRMGQKQKPPIGKMGHKQATWIFTNSAVRISNLVTYNASYLPFQRPGDLLL